MELWTRNVTTVIVPKRYTLINKLEHWCAVNITGISRSLDEYFLMKSVKKGLRLLNQSGLEKDLGITKEGVQRLIWLLDDVRNTKRGSEVSSLETISLVRNALLKERILKQTTILLDLQPSLMKKELQPMSKRWQMNDYGIKTMDVPYVGGVTGVTV